MRFAFDDEHLMLRDSVRGTLERDAPFGRVREWSRVGDLQPFATLAARQGWYGIGLEEASGGQGGGMLERAILHEELGRAAAPSAGLATAAVVLELLAGEPGAASLVEAVAEGHQAVGLAADAGKPFDRPIAAFRVEGSACEGTEQLVLNAPDADVLVVPTWDGETVTLWSVLASEPGVEVHQRQLVDRARAFGDVDLRGVKADPLGTVPAEAMRRALAGAVVLSAAESLGAARKMLEMTVSYAGDRKQFGVPIGSFQAVKHAAAQALVDIEAAHSGVYFAAWALQTRAPRAELHSWIAKAFAADMGARVADVALQLHGAIGYTWEYDLHVLFKRAKANQQLLGSAGHYRERVAAALDLTGTRLPAAA